MTRKKIAIINGSLSTSDWLTCCESLALEFDPEVFTFEKNARNLGHHCLPINLVSDDEKVPGFMAGLEHTLKKFDYIIVYEPSQLVSFQATRIASRYNKPTIVISTEENEQILRGLKNLESIRFDVMRSAENILVYSQKALHYVSQVYKDKNLVSKIRHNFNLKKFYFDQEKRRRFRQALKISDNDRVILCNNNHRIKNGYADVIFAAQSALSINPKLNLKVIIVDDRKNSEELKYLAHDTGLGSRAMFLHQDPQPFITDLYCASDLCVYPFEIKLQSLNIDTMEMQQAMACGVIPCVPSGCGLEELSQGKGFLLSSQGALPISQAILAIADENFLIKLRNKVIQVEQKPFSFPTLGETIVEIIRKKEKAYTPKFENTPVSKIDLKTNHDIEDLIIDMEDLVLKENISLPQKATALAKIGTCYLKLGNYKTCMQYYQKAVETDEFCWSGFRGLGFLALRNHAFHEAFSFFRKTLNIKPDDPESCFGMGLYHKAQNNPSEALVWLERALLQNKLDGAFVAISQISHNHPSPSLAVAALERLRDIYGDQQNLLLSLGKLYFKLGKEDQGQKYINRGLNSVSDPKL